MAAVSATRRRTAVGAEFAQYSAAVWANRAGLDKAYSGRHRALDGFLSGLGTHPEGGKLYFGLGARFKFKFNSLGRGGRAVPTTRVRHHMDGVQGRRSRTAWKCCWSTSTHDQVQLPCAARGVGSAAESGPSRIAMSESAIQNRRWNPPVAPSPRADGRAGPASRRGAGRPRRQLRALYDGPDGAPLRAAADPLPEATHAVDKASQARYLIRCVMMMILVFLAASKNKLLNVQASVHKTARRTRPKAV